MEIQKIIENQQAKKLLERILNNPAFDYFDNHKGRPGHQGGSLPRTESEAALSKGSAKHSGSGRIHNQVESKIGVVGAQIRNWAVEKGMATKTENRKTDREGKLVGGASMAIFNHKIDSKDLEKIEDGTVFYGGSDGGNGAKIYQYSAKDKQWISNVKGQVDILHKNDIKGLTGVVIGKDELDKLRTKRGEKARQAVQRAGGSPEDTTETRFGFKMESKRMKSALDGNSRIGAKRSTFTDKPLSEDEEKVFETASNLQGEAYEAFAKEVETGINPNNTIYTPSENVDPAVSDQVKGMMNLLKDRRFDQDCSFATEMSLDEIKEMFPTLEGKNRQEILKEFKGGNLADGAYKGFLTAYSDKDKVKAPKDGLKVVFVAPKGTNGMCTGKRFKGTKKQADTIFQAGARFTPLGSNEKTNTVYMYIND